ncbi:hypothetical protein GALMADRAFT_928714 [Galerina marginata CBS 339.88]|uniref:Uncharacterized protein n=1 Tax=Galerina marginata (strain CBS 339.88) TaxID=685588 RepID=A0A067SR93_GALM3|nr:hypothetical protein GALMADRAFT_928714 [Galerina marginata CBS 339.88]
MYSVNNEATPRRRSSKRNLQSRPSVDSEYGAQIGRNDAINLNPRQALPEENWSRIGNDDDRQEFRHRPSFRRISTEPPSIARTAPPSLESRSLSFPGTAGPDSSLGPHLHVPTANPGWSSHSDNATESTVTGSYNILPTNICDSKLSQRTRNLNHRTIVNGHNPNFRSMQDGTSSMAEESPFFDLDAPEMSNSPTATTTSRSHESNSQANFSGTNSYVNPTHYMAPHRIAQPQPMSAAPVIGKGRPHEVHARREKRSMGSVPGNLSDGPPTCVGDTSKLDHAPPFGLQDWPHGHSMVHFEGISSNQRTEHLSSEVDGTGKHYATIEWR